MRSEDVKQNCVETGKTDNIYDIDEVVGKTFPSAFTIANITGIQKISGICPICTNIFSNHELPILMEPDEAISLCDSIIQELF